MNDVLTVEEVLARWLNHDVDEVSAAASDRDIWYLARMSVIIAGRRAQQVGNKRYEHACANFIRALGGLKSVEIKDYQPL